MELGGEGFKFGVARVKRPEVLQAERMLLDCYVMELARLAAKSLPGGEEVEAEAEAGLEDDEALAAGPARGQCVALEEDVRGLRRAAGCAVVDVVEGRGVRRAFLERRCGRNQGANAESFLAPSPTFWPP
jgi:hypothetical protein